MKRLVALFAVLFILESASARAQGFKGRVVFEGTPPPVEKVEVKSDVPVCGTHQEVSKILLGKDNGIANVVVKVLNQKGSPAAKNGTLDQVQCQFVPPIQVLGTGSTLVITSSDSVLHNAHGFFEDGSTAFNIAVPIVGMEVKKKLTKPGVIKLRCDAGHTWMSGYVIVADEPYFAVTDADGNFTVEGLPDGHYDLEMWHEWLGKKTESVDVKTGVPVMIAFKEAK